MKNQLSVICVAITAAFLSVPAYATCGHNNNKCAPKNPPINVDVDVSAKNTANGGSGHANATNTATNTAKGGAGGHAEGGNANATNTANGGHATGGNSAGGNANATTGDNKNTNISAVSGSGNSENRNSNSASNHTSVKNDLENNTNVRTGANTLTGTNTASGGAGGSSASSSGSSNGDQITAIDASNNSRTISFQSHQHIPAMTVGAGSSVTSTMFACGPLQSVSQEKVAGHVIGILSKDTIDDLGKTETLKPYMVDGKLTRFHKEIDGDTTTLWGHQVLVSSTVIGVSGGRSFSLGGARADSSANGGAGANGSMQRMVKEITLRDCMFSSKTITQLPKVASVVTPKELPMVVGNIKE